MRKWSLVISNYTGRCPEWVINIFEDVDLLSKFCKCKQYVTRGTDVYLAEERVARLLMNLFYQNLFQNFITIDLDALLFNVSALIFPLYFAVSIINVIIIAFLVKNQSSIFIFQFFQSIAVLLTMTFESFFCSVIFFYIFPDYYSVGKTFTLWCHIMAVTLVLDRFISIYKPVIFKKYSTPKIATLFSFILLLICFIITIPIYLIDHLKLPDRLYGWYYLIYSILLLLSAICIVMIMITFHILLKKITSKDGSQLKSHETNINRIVLLSAFIDILPTLNCFIYIFSMSMFHFYPIGPTHDVWVTINKKSRAVYNVVLPLSPLLSIIVCSIYSKLYRLNLKSVFCYSCHSNIVSPITPLKYDVQK